MYHRIVHSELKGAQGQSAPQTREIGVEMLAQGFDGDCEHVLRDPTVAAERATAIILAGGKSTRMGFDKALLPIHGRPMVQQVVDQLRPVFNQILIVADDVEKFAFLGLEVVRDEVPDVGPLMAVVSGLRVSAHDLNLVVGCDMPSIDTDFVVDMLREAGAYDCVVPVTCEGHFEPLLAVYRKSVLEQAEAVLAGGHRRIACLFDRCKVKYVSLPESDCARNLNTFDDYVALLSAREHSGLGAK